MQHSANRGLGGLAVHPGDGFLPLPVCLLVLGDRSSALSPFISIKFLFLVFFFFGGFYHDLSVHSSAAPPGDPRAPNSPPNSDAPGAA